MQTETTPHQPVNHVFVDMENVKRIDAAVIGGKNYTFHLFYGPQNKKLEMGVAERLFENSLSVMMVRSPKRGKNALDFVLAYHLGQAVMADPKGSFHIIAPDTGYESLVDLLNSRNVKIEKHADWSGLKCRAAVKTPVKPSQTAGKALSDAAEKLLGNLRKAAKNRPKKKKTLVSHAMNLIGKDADEGKALKVIEELMKAKFLEIDDKDAVTYKL